MTRKELREGRADWLLLNWALKGNKQRILDILEKVEKEAWETVTDKFDKEMENENEFTDDLLWEIRDWCREQKKAV